MKKTPRTTVTLMQLSLAASAMSLLSPSQAAENTASLEEIEINHQAQAEHVEQSELFELVAAGQHQQAFEQAFELGDELFETTFNRLDGVGAQVGDGQLFTRVPRADLTAAGEWATHIPKRATGPNGQSCNSCHNQPSDDGAGTVSSNAHRDPLHSASMSSFITRNTPHVFGLGAVQRLAEEMTEDLQRQRDRAIDKACQEGVAQTESLRSKDIAFGSITVSPITTNPCQVDINIAQVQGVNTDLVIRPLQWKGSEGFIRKFNRDAAHNELGMQAVELVGYGIDGDGDGVSDEMTIGDQTALSIYLAAQPRPVTQLELDELDLIPALSREQRRAIRNGEQRFEQIGCASCHTPALKLDNPIFYEPSRSVSYRDDVFPGGQDPKAEGVDPSFAVSFDLTRDQPDNIIHSADGHTHRLGSFDRDRRGQAVIQLYSDLKRHDMGAALAENIDEVGTGASTWMTEALWGVGSTAPYLHDGRATTLTEAILAHGGEAEASQQAFQALAIEDQQSVIEFLENLVLFKQQ